MSFFGTLASGLAQRGFSALVGGNGSNVNLARNFSARRGLPCTVRDDQKGLVDDLLARGLTGQQVCNAAGSGIPGGTLGDVIARKLPPALPGVGNGGGIGTPPIVPPGGPPTAGAIGMSILSRALPTVIGRGAGRVIGPAVGRLPPGPVFTQTGRLSGVVLATGRRLSRRNIASFIRFLGDITLAATILGISVQDAADVVTTKTRRRRGITGPQLASAKRVICTINKMSKELNCKPTTRRRTSCR